MSLKELRNSFVVTLTEMGCTTRQIKRVLSMECDATIRLLSYEQPCQLIFNPPIANVRYKEYLREVTFMLVDRQSPLQMIMEAIKVSFAFYL